MKNAARAMTLPELLVATAVLLLMVAVTSAAVIGYLRSYRIYSHKGGRLLRASSTLEALCRELRSCRSLQGPVPANLQSGPLRLTDAQGQSLSIFWQSGSVCADSRRLGVAENVLLELQGDELVLTLPYGGIPPLRTAVSVRGKLP